MHALEAENGFWRGQSRLAITGVGETAVGDWVSVPKGVIWCQLHFRETLVGKLVRVHLSVARNLRRVCRVKNKVATSTDCARARREWFSH